MRGRCAALPLLPLLAATAEGHGAMSIPPARNSGRNATTANADGCQNGACQFFSQGCNIGCRCTEATGGDSFLRKLCGANSTAQPTVNDPKYRTFNRHPAPQANDCSGPSQANTSVPAAGECYETTPGVGPWVTATCDGLKGAYCAYNLPGCTGAAQCGELVLDGMCHELNASGITYHQKATCSNGVLNMEQWGTNALGDWTAYHPWRSPGTAGVLDPCGLAGGSTKDNTPAGGFGNESVGKVQGFPGSKLPRAEAKTVWTAGSTPEVQWGIAANHGGGYQYRLCPAGAALTEACFQRTPLDFAGDTQRLRWANGDEVEIPATRVSEGTTPAGSTWSMVPVPACDDMTGGFKGAGCERPAFSPPPGCNATCWGYQSCKYYPGPNCNTAEIPAIVDRVHVPAGIPPGDYVVGFRWDCEQTPQVWQSCGDVAIVAA